MLFSGPIDFTRVRTRKYTYIYINIHIYIKRDILYINIIINIIISRRGIARISRLRRNVFLHGRTRAGEGRKKGRADKEEGEDVGVVEFRDRSITRL